MNLSLRQLQNEAMLWNKLNFPDAQPYQPLLGVAEEVGELAHAHLKMEQGIRRVKQGDKIDAVGDIIVFLAVYCGLNDIDLQAAIEKVWADVRKRDWRNNPRTGRE